MLLKLGQWLYKRYPNLHKWFYFAYKSILDRNLINLLNHYIKPGFVILDIGANIGFFACLLAKGKGSKSKIYAFEPDDENCKRFRSNTQAYKNITLISKALSSDNKPRQLYISDLLNVDHRMYPSKDHSQTVLVPTTSIDTWMQESGENAIDLIKMDVQGYEVEVLLGMSAMLNSKHKPVIISEFWPYGLKSAGSTCEQFFKLLHDADYCIYLIQGKTHVLLTIEHVPSYSNLPESMYFNILAIPQSRGI